MAKKNTYENIIKMYKEDVDKGREYLYSNMGVLMRKNPILKSQNYTYTVDDIHSEAFLLADAIIMRTDVDDNKKISKLWFLFNKWWWPLYNVINQYRESYTIDDYSDNEKLSYELNDDMLEYVLLINNVISPIEDKILIYLQEWRWRYEIARLLKTTYNNVKQIIDLLTLKIERFIQEINKDADNS